MKSRADASIAALWCSLLLALSACSTPPAALDNANQGVKLMSLMDAQLHDFRRIQQLTEQSMIESMRVQRETIRRVKRDSAVDTLAAQAAGDNKLEPMAKSMAEIAEAIHATRAADAAATAANDTRLDALLAPMPSTTKAIAEVQAKLAKMGIELDRETRLKELRAFVDEVRRGVEKIKEKLAQAEKDAAAASKALAIGTANP